jgi:diadenosine tetraphosphate (Ap4A) HIT family hydrolase
VLPILFMYCSLTTQGSTTAYPVKMQVGSISGSHVHFHITGSQTPGHFTTPG